MKEIKGRRVKKSKDLLSRQNLITSHWKTNQPDSKHHIRSPFQRPENKCIILIKCNLVDYCSNNIPEHSKL